MGIERRRHERFEVRLQVQFLDARSFVEQYAYNISQGGLFVNAPELEMGQELTVQLQLPGYDPREVRCQVAHVTPEDSPDGRMAGAGLQIVEAPADFHEALRDYLKILSQRKETRVFVDEDYDFNPLLERAGYRVERAPPPEAMPELLRDTSGALGVIATGSQAADFRRVLKAVGLESLVIEVLPTAASNSVLNALDRRIASRPEMHERNVAHPGDPDR